MGCQVRQKRGRRMKSWFVITGCLAVGLTTWNQAQAQIFGLGQPIPERHSLPLCAAASDIGCYDRPDFSVAESVTKLGKDTLAYWVTGSDLRIVARGDKPQLCCTFSDDMFEIGEDAKSKIWGLRLYLPNIDETRLELGLVNMINGRATLKLGTPFVGSNAPADAEKSQPLKGKLETIEIDSSYLGEKRKVTFYTPRTPPPASGYPVVYMADGQDTETEAAVVDALIESRKIRPVLLVGIWHGEGPFTATYPPDKRGKEYLPGANADPKTYAQHEAFVKNEVMPLAEKSYLASRNRTDRLTYGSSNGAAWALSFVSRQSDLFAQASGFGVATTPDTIDFSAIKNVRIFVGAGRYDGFFGNSRGICDRATLAGLNCTFYSIYSGHDQAMWDYGLVKTLEQVFTPGP